MHMHISFFFNDTATTEIYAYGHTLSLHDALPISPSETSGWSKWSRATPPSTTSEVTCTSRVWLTPSGSSRQSRSEEHTSELQSLMRISYAVFCLKKQNYSTLTSESTLKDIRDNHNYKKQHNNKTECSK